MSKTVINLVKELGVKSTKDVFALLRDAGVDVEAEGFGVMSKIDDAVVAKLKASTEAAAAPGKKARGAAASSDGAGVEATASPAEPAKPVARKDFFGSKAPVPGAAAASAAASATASADGAATA